MINSLIDSPNFIGHKDVREQIEKSILSNNITHAHIFYGEDGIGKSLIAQETALKILGKNKIKEYPDIIKFRLEKDKKSIGVEYVRNIIQEINKKPSEGDKKVIIIYQGDKMTEEAQNAFLKTVEEPPFGIFIIILCENLDAMLDTIKSRSQIHKLSRLNNKEMKEFLISKKPDITNEDLRTIIAFSEGIPGRAEKFFSNKTFKEIRDKALEILAFSCTKLSSNAFDYGDFLVKHKDQWEEVLMWILSFIRDIMVYKETQKEDMIINLDKIQDIKKMSSMFSFNKLNRVVNEVNKTQDKIKRNVNLAITFDVMLLNIQEE